MSAERFKVGFISAAAKKEYDALDGSVRDMVDKGMLRLALRAHEIGKPLAGALAGCKELKFRANGIRLIFRICGNCLEVVEIITISSRERGKAFEIAKSRVAKSKKEQQR